MATRSRTATSPARSGAFVRVLRRGADFEPLDLGKEINRVAWVKWEGQTQPTAEPVVDLIKWA